MLEANQVKLYFLHKNAIVQLLKKKKPFKNVARKDEAYQCNFQVLQSLLFLQYSK